MDNTKTLQVIFALFVLLAIVGFYMAFDKIATLSTTVSNLELAQQINKKAQDVTTPTPPESAPATASTPESSSPAELARIPTAILFDTLSAPTLKPQATTTITIEAVSKMSDGTLTMAIKAFTKNTSSYSALDPKAIFFLIDTNGDSQPAMESSSAFSSMSPQSATEGHLIFKPASDRNSFIFQVGAGDDTKFYEFDFVKKTYKETIIG